MKKKEGRRRSRRRIPQNKVAAVGYEDLKKVKRYVLYTEMKEEKVEMWMGKSCREIDR